LVGIIIAILASVCSHLRFKDKTITGITIVGLVAVLFVGAGIFTLKEAVIQITDLAK
jgi:predicted transporter